MDFLTTAARLGSAAPFEWTKIDGTINSWVRKLPSGDLLIAPVVPAKRYWMILAEPAYLRQRAYDLSFASLRELDIWVDNWKPCPKCDDPCDRDSVDVGVGIIHGPWGCSQCGWSEDPDYDRSSGPAPADSFKPGWYSDQFGSLHSKARLAEDIRAAGERFGLDFSDLEIYAIVKGEDPNEH